MSEFAPEYGDWPAEADAVAGNVDYPDDYVDNLDDGGYGYADELYTEPVVDTDSPEFHELARQYAIEHAQDVVSQLVESQLAPLHAEMQAAVEQQFAAEGMDQIHSTLEEWGVAADDRQTVFDHTKENLQQAADQIGVDVPTFLREWDLLAGGDGSGDAAALTALEMSAASLARAREYENVRDEQGVYDFHFRRGPLLDEHGPTTPLQPSAPGDEFSVLRKWFPNN